MITEQLFKEFRGTTLFIMMYSISVYIMLYASIPVWRVLVPELFGQARQINSWPDLLYCVVFFVMITLVSYYSRFQNIWSMDQVGTVKLIISYLFAVIILTSSVWLLVKERNKR